MARPEKVEAVEAIKARFDAATAVFVTEYRGLSVTEQQELRRGLRGADTEYKVLKMSLTRLAVADLELAELDEALFGPTAIAFTQSDPVPAAKTLKDFAKDHEHLVVKIGLLDGVILPPEQISKLADIEPREVLLAKIAGGAKAPLFKLAGFMASFTRDAASMFGQLLDKKEEEAPAAPAEEPAAAAEEPARDQPAASDDQAADEPAATADVPESAAETEHAEAPDAPDETGTDETGTDETGTDEPDEPDTQEADADAADPDAADPDATDPDATEDAGASSATQTDTTETEEEE